MGKFVANIFRWQYRLIVFISLIVLCINCIDPFTLDMDSYKLLLVVDALITDDDAANYVKLSWTSQIEGEYKMVSNAVVAISDDSGNSVTLKEQEKGEYWTDPSTFRGEVGKSYTLSIVAPNGEEYSTEPCLMYPVNEIDSLYYTYYEAVPEGYLDPYKGVNIYASTPAESASGYRRWKYDEWWKFKVPYPTRVQYLGYGMVTEIEPENETCWSHNPSMDINLNTDISSDKSTLKHPILFLPSELTNRFQTQYFIEVKQLSISREEYAFWNAMRLLNEAGGNLFDSQPFSLVGNVKNVNNSSKNALGYFQVSSVSSNHIYITYDDIENLGLPKHQYKCDLLMATPEYYGYRIQDFREMPELWNLLYSGLTHSGYSLFWYNNNTDGSLAGLTFVLSHCADCTKSGQLDPPDFWEDL